MLLLLRVMWCDVVLLLIFKLTKHKAPTLGELGPEHESVVSVQPGGDTLSRVCCVDTLETIRTDRMWEYLYDVSM